MKPAISGLLIGAFSVVLLGVSTHGTGHHAKPVIIVPGDSDVCVPAPHFTSLVAPECWQMAPTPSPTPKPTATPKHPKGLTL